MISISPSYICQNEKDVFNKEVWEQHRNGIDYGDLVPEEEKDEEPQIKPEKVEKHKPLDVPWLKAVLFGSIILILLFILYKIFGNMVFGGKIRREEQKLFSLEEIEENLEEADLEFHLEAALTSADYRKAIRVYYLSIIKELSLRDWIQWKKDKTNYHYLREMRPRNQFDSFRDLTLAFEIVWYGDADISEYHFDHLKPIFNGFLNRL